MHNVALAAVPDSRTHVKVLYKEYYARRKGPTTIEVAKFVNGSDAPLDYYTLEETPQGIKCDCQGSVIHPFQCRHVWIYPEFKRLEQTYSLEDLYPCSWIEEA